MQSKRYGFTLIELLVVIAIIAILAAILFPAFMAAREKSRQSVCINNMGQLAKAFRMYLDDYGRYPQSAGLDWFARWSRNNSHGSWIWFDGQWVDTGGFHYDQPPPWGFRCNPARGALWAYTGKNRKIFICPSDKHSRYKGQTSLGGGFALSYTMNCNIHQACYGDSSESEQAFAVDESNRKFAVPALESQIVRPTRTVLLADQGDGSLTTHPDIVNAVGANNAYCPSYDGVFRWWEHGPTPVHCGGQNWSFCDGHVRWLSLKQWNTLIFYRDGRPTDPSQWTNHRFDD